MDSKRYGFDVSNDGEVGSREGGSYGGPPSEDDSVSDGDDNHNDDGDDDEEEDGLSSPAPSYKSTASSKSSNYVRNNKVSSSFSSSTLEALFDSDQLRVLRGIFGSGESREAGNLVAGLRNSSEATKLFSGSIVSDALLKLNEASPHDVISWGEFMGCIIRGRAEEIGIMR